ncbi:MAG: hypothetical protein KDB79_06195 [Acidobacteria bacterium]|nr:hypothetical protein [Acidobacteriota bacterium]
MYKTIILFTASFFVLLSSLSISAQDNSGENGPTQPMPPNPYQTLKKYIKEQNNYITPIFELENAKKEYLASPLKGIYLDYMTYLQGMVGNYREMYRYEEDFLKSLPITENSRIQNSTDIKISPLKDHKEIDAVKAIEKVAETEQVIMINEEHRTPHHRAFTTQLLQGLYNKGFRYLAIEALYSTDNELNKRRYPIQKTGSIYISDPVFGDMIRTALQIGYKLVPYEFEGKCIPKPPNPFECNQKREKEQAQNIYDRILKNDPKAKILVHAGRDHIAKVATPELTMMAKHFEEITKITPFSIDQMRLSERHDPADEIPLYRYLAKQNLRNPTVFETPGGEYFGKSESHDMFVFHPRMKYENGRPTWLEMDGERRSTVIDPAKLKLNVLDQKLDDKESFLVQAFYLDESPDAIPIDQVLISPNEQIPALMLPIGNFKIRTMNESGEITAEYTEKVQNNYFIVFYSLGKNWDSSKAPNEQLYFKDHSQHLSKLRKEKRISIGGRYGEKGLLILKALDLAEAEKRINEDIAMKNDLFSVEIYPFAPFYNGSIK